MRYGESLPKKAGDTITCPRCAGKGYTLEGMTSEVAIECRRCGGSGVIVIQKARP